MKTSAASYTVLYICRMNLKQTLIEATYAGAAIMKEYFGKQISGICAKFHAATISDEKLPTMGS